MYVDGYYVGMVDSFDGTFQRLHLSPGEHVIEIFLEGHRTIREPMIFQPERDISSDARWSRWPPGTLRPNGRVRIRRRGARPLRIPAMRERHDRIANPRDRFGATSGARSWFACSRATPRVIVDGQKWDTPAGREPLTIHLSEGPHRIEVQKTGIGRFRPRYGCGGERPFR